MFMATRTRTFSDVFEEQGVVKTPFYGGYGLIAERGIPKASFHAFELLHQLGNERLNIPLEDLLVTRTNGRLVIALWNYAEPDQALPAKTFVLDVRGMKAKHYRVRIVDPKHGSSLAIWQEMGQPRQSLTHSNCRIAKTLAAGERD
jgi:xylan 1,4-beta-xylosidase